MRNLSKLDLLVPTLYKPRRPEVAIQFERFREVSFVKGSESAENAVDSRSFDYKPYFFSSVHHKYEFVG